MNKEKILDYLSHKTFEWRLFFCNFFIEKHGLQHLRLKTDLEPEMLVRCCNSVDELDELWSLAEFIDFYETEFNQEVGIYRFCRPIPWQYEFVEEIRERLEIISDKFLNLEAIIDVYCAALWSDKIDLAAFINGLDKKYGELYLSAAHKTKLFKRNLSLVLESMADLYGCSNAAELNFRELVERYIGKIGVAGFAKAMKAAKTDEVRLTPEERSCFGFSYYSPYFCDDVEIQAGVVLSSSIFACVEDKLQQELEYREYLQNERYRMLSQSHPLDDDAEDEDDEDCEDADDEINEDDIIDELEETHSIFFVDPQERCLIDVQYGEIPYAYVYIEKFPQDNLNNQLPDFIRLHHGFLYTVEFVDDLQSLDAAKKFLRYVNTLKAEMMITETKLVRDEDPSPEIPKKFEDLCEELSFCYYISE